MTLSIAAAKELWDAMRSTSPRPKMPQTAVGTVVQAEPDIMVQLDGAHDPTPVASTVSSVQPGDVVSVSLECGSARIVGNLSRPSTDDAAADAAGRTARVARAEASDAAKTATSYIDWDEANDGAVTIGRKLDGSFVGSRAVLGPDGLDFQDDDGESLSRFGASARVGKESGNHVSIDDDSIDLMHGDETVGSFGINGAYAASVKRVEYQPGVIGTGLANRDVWMVTLTHGLKPGDAVKLKGSWNGVVNGNVVATLALDHFFVARSAAIEVVYVYADAGNATGGYVGAANASELWPLIPGEAAYSALDIGEINGSPTGPVTINSHDGLSTVSVGGGLYLSTDGVAKLISSSIDMHAFESGSRITSPDVVELEHSATGYSVGVGVGSGGVDRGLYDMVLGKWLINLDGNGIAYVLGKMLGLGKWTNPGTNNQSWFGVGDMKVAMLTKEVSLSGSAAPYFGSYTWTFSSAFSAPPYVVVSAQSGSSTLKDLRATCDSVTATNCKVYISRSSSTATVVHAIAIGKA